MVWQIKIEKRAEKELERIPEQFQDKILAVLPLLAVNPYIGKKLKGKYQNLYSYRVWPYRITYRIEKNIITITVLSISHRQGAYK